LRILGIQSNFERTSPRVRREREKFGRCGARLKTKELGMTKILKPFLADESGATAIEYALMSSLIALALVTALTSLGSRLSGEFSEVSAALK
jgi:pilus assembly protein Flp/PilA